jgi:hypothetical protein
MQSSKVERVFLKDGDPKLARAATIPARLQPFASYYLEVSARANKIQENFASWFGSFEEGTRGWKFFGVNKHPTEPHSYVIREWLEGAKRVWVFGEFNGWQRRKVELKRDDFSTFTGEFRDARASNAGRGSQFRYR